MRMARFSLLDIARVIAIAAFALLFLFRTRGNEQSIEMRFGSMPPNDQALESWLRENDWPTATIHRDEDSVTVKSDTGFLQLRLLRPPWQDLGYDSAKGGFRSSITASRHFLPDSLRYAIVFALVMMGLNLFERRVSKPSAGTADEVTQQDQGRG